MAGSSRAHRWRWWMWPGQTKGTMGSQWVILCRAEAVTWPCRGWQAWQPRVLIVGRPLGRLWVIQLYRCWQPIRLIRQILCSRRRQYQLRGRSEAGLVASSIAMVTKFHHPQLQARTWRKSEEQPIILALFKIRWTWSRKLNQTSSSWSHRISKKQVLLATSSSRLSRIKPVMISWTFASILLIRCRTTTTIIRTWWETVMAKVIHLQIRWHKQEDPLHNLRTILSQWRIGPMHQQQDKADLSSEVEMACFSNRLLEPLIKCWLSTLIQVKWYRVACNHKWASIAMITCNELWMVQWRIRKDYLRERVSVLIWTKITTGRAARTEFSLSGAEGSLPMAITTCLQTRQSTSLKEAIFIIPKASKINEIVTQTRCRDGMDCKDKLALAMVAFLRSMAMTHLNQPQIKWREWNFMHLSHRYSRQLALAHSCHSSRIQKLPARSLELCGHLQQILM